MWDARRKKNKKKDFSLDFSLIEKKRKFIVQLFLGLGVFVVFTVLVCSTIWTTHYSKKGTDLASTKVSEFYIKEIANQNLQIVNDDIERHFTYLSLIYFIITFFLSNISLLHYISTFISNYLINYYIVKYTICSLYSTLSLSLSCMIFS